MKQIKKLISKLVKPREILTWEQYKAKIDFLEVFEFQQSVRRSNVRRL